MSGDTITVAGLAWAPLLPWAALAALFAAALPVVAWGTWRRARGTWWRGFALAALLLVLANPQVVREARRSLDDVAIVVVDDSPSQHLGERPAQTARALAAVEDRLAALPNLEVRVVRAGGATAGDGGQRPGTHLFDALDKARADVPADRLAGAVMITDGQIHDLPEAAGPAFPAPLHGLITGHRGETDRRLDIEAAPTFGLVGDTVSLRLKAVDSGPTPAAAIAVTVTVGDGAPRPMTVTSGQAVEVPVTLDHGGPNVVEVAAAARPDDLTTRNNRTAVTINGVRDRLRVLLISGSPHVGERAWRGLLKADPNVDLVHFTILRPPTKDDGTPLSELALIAFPIRELFEERLDDFDLIIFDRYSRSGLVPFGFLENIADYVRHGGAVFLVAGPEYAGPYSLFDSPLGDILPAAPTGRILEGPFRPRLGDLGRRHPVTATLDAGAGRSGDGDEPPWGPWTRLVEGRQRAGALLMTGDGGTPLMLLDRVGAGRVALLLSDTLWLWGRDYQGGGPQAELVRRTAHWLMKEPDLEEEALTAQVDDGRLTIARRTLDALSPDAPPEVAVTAPDGTEQRLPLAPDRPGRATATIAAGQPGVWRVRQGGLSAVAAAAAADPVELRDVVATAARLEPAAAATGGAVRWLADGLPRLERVSPRGRAHGATWLGLRANQAYVVDGIRQTALLPPWAALVLALGALMAAWWREGR
jgi:hypothetical protein